MRFKIFLENRPIWFFSTTLLLYGLWGSPTPNNPDWVEATIAIFLILAIGWQGVISVIFFNPDKKTDHWYLAAQIFFYFGLIIPLFSGLLKGANLEVIFRDVVGFIFLCMPLFLFNLVSITKKHIKIFWILCLGIGFLFSIRVLVPHFLLFRNATELLYLANSPLVLTMALFLSTQGAFLLYRKVNFQNFLFAMGLFLLSALPVMAMFVDLQRASFLSLVLSFIFLSIIGFIKSPLRIVVPLLIMTLIATIFTNYITQTIDQVAIKTSQVGLNMRLQELSAVWDSLSPSVLTILFGQGWGSSFVSPAVGMLNVTYTHSLLSYIFFKMGLVGLILCLVYLYFMFEKLAALVFINPVKGNALIWPFIIPILLYASHKSFDFGLLLTLILVSYHYVSFKAQEASA